MIYLRHKVISTVTLALALMIFAPTFEPVMASDVRTPKVKQQPIYDRKPGGHYVPGKPVRTLNDRQIKAEISRLDKALSRKNIKAVDRKAMQKRRGELLKTLKQRRGDNIRRDRPDGKIDKRPAKALNDKDLRKRLRTTRKALRDQKLSKSDRRRLMVRLKLDRREMRGRIAAVKSRDQKKATAHKNTSNQTKKPTARPDQGLAYVPSNRLDARQLSQRINTLNQQIKSGKLRGKRARQASYVIAQDRKKLDKLRRTALENRRYKRRHKQANGGFRLAPNMTMGMFRADGLHASNIAAAEVLPAEIERQFLTAPKLTPKRRYNVHDLARHRDVRLAMPAVDVDSLHFATNSALIAAEEVDNLEQIGIIIERILAVYPNEVFLIEGHTDAVGSSDYNDRLSLRRAGSVERALTTYFEIGRRNLKTIGLGERDLKIPTPYAEMENRRVSIRRITPLLGG